jgi:hypothetical protein
MKVRSVNDVAVNECKRKAARRMEALSMFLHKLYYFVSDVSTTEGELSVLCT